MAKFISDNPTFTFDIKYAMTYLNGEGLPYLVKNKRITLATLHGDGWKSCMTQILEIHMAKLKSLKEKLEDGSDPYASLQDLITELGFEPDPPHLIKLRMKADKRWIKHVIC